MALEDDLQELIEKRREIDRALLERHAVEMAVLFTDIVGSTAYFEQRGDIEGLALVHRHNDLLFPVVKQHAGRVVKTIGDSIMAVFEKAADGVACAVALQDKLAQETGTAAVERIRIRVGVHFGRVLKDGDDVFGDTVNTAARVASAADGDEVLVSQALLDALPAAGRPVVAPRRPLAAKGKSAPVPVVAVAWRPEDKANAAALSPAAQELFIIEIDRGPTGLRVAAMDGEAERGTVKAYADVPLSLEEIDALPEPFAVLAHDGGQGAYVEALVERGRALFDRALPERVQKRIRETGRHTVRLHVEDTLVHVPWELLHDGTDFLGCRFSVGRMVTARADAAVPPPSTSAREIVVVANPSGDLPHAEEEGRVVEKLFSSAAPGRVVHHSGAIDRAQFLALAARARVLHFAGHVVRGGAAGEGGFVVADGVVTARDVTAAMRESAPLLVFANGCHASTSERWHALGPGDPQVGDAPAASSLAQALLLSGVRHTLAPMWGVPDADALSFALRFYEAALSGVPFGECARRARRALAQVHASSLSFAGYVLYGDPRATLPPDDATLPSSGRTRSGEFPARPAPEPTQTVPTVSMPRAPPPPPPVRAAGGGRSALALGAAGGLLAGVVVVAALLLHPWDEAHAAGDAGVAAAPSQMLASRGEPAPAPPPKPGGEARHEGPVRVSVFPFKASGADASLDYLKQGLAEVVVTELAQADGVKLIERGQIDVDIGELEFAQTKYVDPATRAQLGKIAGAEIAILGSYQVAGGDMRFTARFVDVDSGEVLAAAKADGKKDDVFALQDKLAAAVNKTMLDVKARVRP